VSYYYALVSCARDCAQKLFDKSDQAGTMAYALGHEKELLDQSDRRRMGMHQAPCPAC
jgi:hypothetical protein